MRALYCGFSLLQCCLSEYYLPSRPPRTVLALIPSNLHKQVPGAYARRGPSCLTTLHMSQVHIVHVNPDFTDPDYCLALVFCGLYELNEGDSRCHSVPSALEQAGWDDL